MESKKLLKLLKDHNGKVVESLGYSQDYEAVDIFYEMEGAIIMAAENDEKDVFKRIYPLLKKLYGLNGNPDITLNLNNKQFRGLVERYAKFQTKHYKNMLGNGGNTYREMLEKTYGKGLKKHIKERYDLLIKLVGGISDLMVVSGGIIKETKTKLKLKMIKRIAINILEKAREEELK